MFTAIRKFDPVYQVEIFDGSEKMADSLEVSFPEIVGVDFDEIDECAWLTPGGYAAKGDFITRTPEGNIVVLTERQFEEGFLRQ